MSERNRVAELETPVNADLCWGCGAWLDEKDTDVCRNCANEMGE